MDVHRDFCEVAIAEDDGRVRSAGRIETTLEDLQLFARSLALTDVVALEATSGSGLIAEVIEPHVVAVLVANTRKLPQISKAKAKTDRLDARTLARLAASGFLDTVWAPDERKRALRRLCARREALVRARTRAKNEAHAVPARNLCGRPPVTDCFGKQDRAWLASLQLPLDERSRPHCGGVHGRRRRHPPLHDATAARRLSRPGPARPPIRHLPTPATAASARPARVWRARCSARPPGRSRRPPARYARSSSASAPARARRSPPPRRPASSRACSGACSPANRTTPSRVPR